MNKKRVIAIKRVDRQPVVALTTSTKTFIANGLFNHNCSSCNISHNNNPAPFTLAIIKEHGSKRIEYLEKTAREAVGNKIPDRVKREWLETLQSYLSELTSGS